MSADAHTVLLTFPPRELSPLDRALVGEWLAHAGDIAGAYACERRADDPALYRRIVVIDNPEGHPNYLIHQPSGLATWVKTTVGPYVQAEMFDTLRAALNSIRPVLADTAEGPTPAAKGFAPPKQNSPQLAGSQARRTLQSGDAPRVLRRGSA
jgi:hypothetical protein